MPSMQRRLAALAEVCATAVGRRPTLAQSAQATAVLDSLVSDLPTTAEPAGTDVLDLMREQFELSAAEADLLVVAAAPDLDVRFSAVYELLTGGTQLRPTMGLALELCARDPRSTQARHSLGPAGALRRQSLLTVEGAEPAMLRILRVPERVVDHLLGVEAPTQTVTDMLIDVPARPCPEAERLANGLAIGVRLAHVRSRPGTSGLATAAGAFSMLGSGSLVVDLTRRPAGAATSDVVGLAIRDAALATAGLVLTGVEASLVEDRSLIALLESAPVPTVVVDDLVWDGDWARVPVVTVEATALSAAERAEMWKVALDPARLSDEELTRWSDLVSLRMSPQDIVAAARTALLTAAIDDEDLTVGRLREAARSQGSTRLQESTSRTVPQATMNDLVLPQETRQPLEEMLSWVRHRETVLDSGRLMGRGSKGRGVVALFTGSPGTGKTLAAEAIAGELGIDLFTVDLSSILDKYIGETEKHLERIIREAESLDVLLFFDEADALFGARSAVSDARDRYANHGVSYLLQRIEQFDGLAVLATNYRGNIDRAFSRRMHHIVNFADPEAATRRVLWETHLREAGAPDPDDPLDLDWLADDIEFSGGDIRNVVLTAVFAAAAESAPLGMRHMTFAVRRTHEKLGRKAPIWSGALT